jgi:iron(III) transport system ATP-binding protein
VIRWRLGGSIGRVVTTNSIPTSRRCKLLSIYGATKIFAGSEPVRALGGVDLEVTEGEFFTLLGPSGCGKTTLLRCVAGLESLDGGSIRIDNEVVVDVPARGRVRSVPTEQRPIGMVFQSYAIWPHMTVYENAAYPLRHGRYRVPARQIPDTVNAMLAKMGLERYSSRESTALSGGQQQRLALARALLGKPKLLLLDEPLSNLDAKLRVSLRAELKEIQREAGVTTLYVTHDQTEALAMSDRLAVMRDGLVAQRGTPRELYDAPQSRFVADFLGESNIFDGTVKPGGHVESALGLLHSTSGLPAGSRVHVCIRPEDFRVCHPSTQETVAQNVIAARVLTAEFLGEYVAVQLESCGVVMKGKVHRRDVVTAGDTVELELPPDRVHLMPIQAAEAGYESVA